MNRSLFAALVVLLAGCGSLDGKLQNVLTTSMTGDRAFVSSLYGPIGITSELRGEDAAELRRLRAAAAAAASTAAAAASAPK